MQYQNRNGKIWSLKEFSYYKRLPAGSGSPEGRLKRPDGCCVPVILLHSLMESHQVKPKLSLLPTAHALPKSNKRQAGELPRTAGKRGRFPLRPTLCSPTGALLSGLRPRPATPDRSCPGARARPPVPTHGSAPRDSLPSHRPGNHGQHLPRRDTTRTSCWDFGILTQTLGRGCQVRRVVGVSYSSPSPRVRAAHPGSSSPKMKMLLPPLPSPPSLFHVTPKQEKFFEHSHVKTTPTSPC